MMLSALGSAFAADACPVTSVVMHCEARCAGVNVTSYAAANPPSLYLLPPNKRQAGGALEAASMFAELASDAGDAAGPHEALTPDQLVAFIGPVQGCAAR
jgi:hypothetical protein